MYYFITKLIYPSKLNFSHIQAGKYRYLPKTSVAPLLCPKNR